MKPAIASSYVCLINHGRKLTFQHMPAESKHYFASITDNYNSKVQSRVNKQLRLLFVLVLSCRLVISLIFLHHPASVEVASNCRAYQVYIFF